MLGFISQVSSPLQGLLESEDSASPFYYNSLQQMTQDFKRIQFEHNL